ncbi:MAG: T9SS type A sorting domain-containing protein, partial [Calditrichaeota bacterium]|nr:T9SS type A sorting domain-containing protein [Calditrichota bacterium]
VYSGQWSALLHEWDDNDDEMVFYSEPVAAEANTWYKISVMAKSDSINTGESYLPSNVVPDRDNNRLGMCFFYHKAPISEKWDLTGGDQFYYFDQRTEKSDGWVEYSVISKSPEDAAGVSVRARFTSYPVGKVWYDDFSVKKVTMVEVPTGVNDPNNYARFELPKEFVLQQNYPNPFNPTTTIAYNVPKDSKIQIEIYNLMGQKVKTLFSGFNAAGSHKIEWDGTNDVGKPLTSGVYLLTLRSGNFVTAKRMTLLK